MKKTASNRSLPEEIIEEILSRLPVMTLLRFKSVSKSLFNLIIGPKFVELHLRRSLILQNSSIILLLSGKTFLASFNVEHPQRPLIQLDIHPDIIKIFERGFLYDEHIGNYIPKIIGICNGVICIKKAKEIVLYNPATQAYRLVPRRVSLALRFRDELIAYDCISDDFKILSIIQHFRNNVVANCETYLYKLRDNSWSKIEFPSRRFHYELSCSHIANNSLYWITYNYDLENAWLMCFDVSSHKFKETPLPTRLIYTRLRDIRLRVLKGRLHMMMFENGFHIWILKEDNCWTRVFHCSESIIYGDKFYLYSRRKKKKKFPCLLQYASSKDKRKIIVGLELKLSSHKPPAGFMLLICRNMIPSLQCHGLNRLFHYNSRKS